MKKIYFSIAFVIAAILSVSCSNTEEIKGAEPQISNAPIIYATQETSTKSSITVDGEGVGTIYWSPADDISIFYGASTPVLYTSTNIAPETTAAFTTSAIIGSTELASTNIWGLYPHDPSAICDGSSITTTLPSTQYGVAGTFDDDLYLTVAHSDNTNLHFFNVCGGIKFSLSRDDITSISFSGNNNEDIAGDITISFVAGLPSVSVDSGEKTITLTPKGGGTFAADTDYYIIAIPQSLTSGFTMTFETESQIGTFNYTTKAVSLKRSIFSKKSDIDDYASFISKPSITNLSASGTANCYIVSGAGNYKFNASVKGNSVESVGSPASVEVLWETFGTSVVPSVGDLVYSVSLLDGYVHFSATDTKGNALIAVKDSEGTILWSWHIWCTDVPVEHNYNNNAGIMMDRNLGATVTTPGDIRSNGLLYQWGRKDPFLGGQSYSNASVRDQDRALSTAIWPSAEEVSTHLSDNTTLLFAQSHPMTYIYGDNRDWYCLTKGYQNNGLWGSEKTVYDPCPSGWHVPASCGYELSSEASNGIWADAINNGQSQFQVTVTTKESGYNFGRNNLLGQYSTIWYPCAGYINGVDGGSLYATGDIAYYWSSSSSEFYERWNSNVFEFDTSGATLYKKVNIYFYSSSRQNGHSVRCQKD